MRRIQHLAFIGLTLTVTQTAAYQSPSTTQDQNREIKLYVLDCGQILARDVSLFNPAIKKGTEMELANPCYLIQYPQGKLLWDAGLNDKLVNTPGGVEVMDGAFKMSVKKTLASQLKAINVTSDKISFLAFSHLHKDHTGNAARFSNATWLLQQTEYDFGHSEHAAHSGYNLRDYLHAKGNQTIKLQGDHDVFGDGMVMIISTPGHTAGHQSLLVKLPQTGPVLLSGDLYHFRANREQYGIPVWNDKKSTIHSFTKIDRLLDQTRAQLWIHHDKDQFDALKKAPHFYN
ncbi:MAG: N-acyl homoserine lactonase family protein [Candidatus Thiodiazotropha sp. (ex Dulcina madagascariensis)]|nr:N-acyl homoserine lactonase family protein [Candidatus Thiodiazotropha sp. (ex Dulcina madagascariensis)]